MVFFQADSSCKTLFRADTILVRTEPYARVMMSQIGNRLYAGQL